MRWTGCIAMVVLLSACEKRAAPTERESASAQAGPNASAVESHGGIFVLDRDASAWRRSQQGFPDSAIVTEFAQQEARLFAATGSQGLWRSDDAAQTWRRLEGVELAELNALAVTGGLIAAGTLNDGVLLSRDHGETWVSENRGCIPAA